MTVWWNSLSPCLCRNYMLQYCRQKAKKNKTICLSCMCREMALNHWFQRHICGTNGAEAQPCQNSPWKSCCCALACDYWAGHLYMHAQQCVWYFSQLLWPLTFKASLVLLGMQPTQAVFQGIINGCWSLMRKKRGWIEGEIIYSAQEKALHFQNVLMFQLVFWCDEA